MQVRQSQARGIRLKESLDEIGSRLRELRELNRVSPEEMAEHLKVPVETYNCYEEGKLDMPASILIGIARRLNVDTGLLLTGEESKMSIFTVTRKGEAVEVERRKQYHYQSLPISSPVKRQSLLSSPSTPGRVAPNSTAIRGRSLITFWTGRSRSP